MCGLIYFFHAHFLRFRTVGTEGQGGRSPPPPKKKLRQISKAYFNRGEGTNYFHHITTCPLGFSYVPTALWSILFCDVNMQRSSELYQFFTESENGFWEQQLVKKNQLSWKVFASLATAIHVSQIMNLCSKSFLSKWLTTTWIFFSFYLQISVCTYLYLKIYFILQISIEIKYYFL